MGTADLTDSNQISPTFCRSHANISSSFHFLWRFLLIHFRLGHNLPDSDHPVHVVAVLPPVHGVFVSAGITILHVQQVKPARY